MSNIQIARVAAAIVAASVLAARADEPKGPPQSLPAYDHIVIVVEENKDFDEIIGQEKAAPYINTLASEGANLTHMFGEEHESQGNYFWLFSGNDQGVGHDDQVPATLIEASNLGGELIKKGLSFKGYSESLPAIGSTVPVAPANCSHTHNCIYGRKHVPWISFADVPDGPDASTSSNLRWPDFPANFADLPTVAFVIPNMAHDMHNGSVAKSVPAGDTWLKDNLGAYCQWAKLHNSLLIVTFDESDDKEAGPGFTDPAADPNKDQASKDLQNRIATIFVGAHVKAGFARDKGATHVNVLRTIEAMYGLPKSGAQQDNAARAGIDDLPITDIFDIGK